MIATGLMVLVQAGKVDLDDPVEQYIGPGLLTVYEGHAKEITVRQLLHHTAGLPVHFNYYYVDERSRPLPLLETTQRFGIIVQQPGEEFCYANLGYALIGQIIARVSGRPLAEFMSEEVYRPLGMTGAQFDPDIDAFNFASHAPRLRRAGGSDGRSRRGVVVAFIRPAGGTLLRWDNHVRENSSFDT